MAPFCFPVVCAAQLVARPGTGSFFLAVLGFECLQRRPKPDIPTPGRTAMADALESSPVVPFRDEDG
ncbi:MAG: hypothetical protein ACK5X3_08510, partial [Pseudomonadota bacterium]